MKYHKSIFVHTYMYITYIHVLYMYNVPQIPWLGPGRGTGRGGLCDPQSSRLPETPQRSHDETEVAGPGDIVARKRPHPPAAPRKDRRGGRHWKSGWGYGECWESLDTERKRDEVKWRLLGRNFVRRSPVLLVIPPPPLSLLSLTPIDMWIMDRVFLMGLYTCTCALYTYTRTYIQYSWHTNTTQTSQICTCIYVRIYMYIHVYFSDKVCIYMYMYMCQ